MTIKDVLQLTKRIYELEDTIKSNQKSLDNKDLIIEELKEALKLAMAKRFSRSAEQYCDSNDPQMDLFDEAEVGVIIDNDTGEIEIPAHTRKSRGKRKPLPEYLPREELEHRLPEQDLLLDNGLKYEIIGSDISEQLDIIPADVKVIKHIRYKYAVKGHEEYGVLTAPITNQAIPKSIASNGLLAHIAQAKYCYHLPLYRQQSIWRELDVDISRSSMSRWMIEMGEAVLPIVEDIMAQIKELPYIQADETTVTILKNNTDPKGSHKGYMWVYNNSAGCVYRYGNRAGKNAKEQLEDYQGYVQTDAYAGYNILFTPDSNRVSVGCWAHARRKFMDVIQALGKNAPTGVSHTLVKLISTLYAIEKKAVRDGRSIQQLKEIRQIKSRPILSKIKENLDDTISRTPPKGLLGKAISYTLNNWQELTRYTEEGYIPIDNNAAENKIRPFAVGRKNWLFSGHMDSAKASSNLFTLIENAKLYNLKIFEYLKYVFTHIGNAKSDKDYEALTPRFAKSHIPKIKITKHDTT